MEQLKLAWLYRFWIVIGVVAIMPIIGFFVDTSRVAAKADQRKRALESTKSGLETNIKTGRFANEKWVEGVDKQKGVLSDQVDGAIEKLYRRQEPIRTFPREVQDKFLAAGPKGNIDVQTMLQYQGLFTKQIQELYRSLEPIDPRLPNSKRLVEVNDALFADYIPKWADPEPAGPTTVSAAWLAQEDVWILRAMMDVVKRANSDAPNWAKSSVKRIYAIKRGPDAADVSVNKKSSTSVWSGPDDIIDPASIPKDSKAFSRYLNANKLYKPVPVYMHLYVHQPDLLKVLAQFPNSDVPMEIKQVEVAQASERPRPVIAKAGATAKDKEALDDRDELPLSEDEYFFLTDVKIYARAYLYVKPKRIEDEENAAKVKAAAGVAAPATKPDAGS